MISYLYLDKKQNNNATKRCCWIFLFDYAWTSKISSLIRKQKTHRLIFTENKRHLFVFFFLLFFFIFRIDRWTRHIVWLYSMIIHFSSTSTRHDIRPFTLCYIGSIFSFSFLFLSIRFIHSFFSMSMFTMRFKGALLTDIDWETRKRHDHSFILLEHRSMRERKDIFVRVVFVI